MKNVILSIVLATCLMTIVSFDKPAKGSEVKIEKALPVTMGIDEKLELIKIEEPEIIEVAEKGSEPEPEPTPDNTYLGEFKITYYCGCTSCSDEWGTMTATGVTAKEGRTIAVDPKVIAYGTKVMINGREYIAEDCGGAIKGNRIDIFVSDHERARKAGVDYFDVYIKNS